jgi:predicted short-subunit dehydrogenase-like oxidoreductase (DUF2520 family)
MNTSSLPTVGFIGAGKVAQTLACAFHRGGVSVVGASSRNADNLVDLLRRAPTAIAMHSAQEVVDRSELVFLTVADDAIQRICEQLSWRASVSVVHCSGATEVSALAHAEVHGAKTGGFHPMQMFTNPDVALAGLAGCTVAIEAADSLLGTLETLAKLIDCNPVQLGPGSRALYHASAYYVGPFLIALLQEGVHLWKALGFDEKQALSALLPLLQGTVSAVSDGGLAKGMGGCVARGDVGTMKKHLIALDTLDPAAGRLYRDLALRNVPLGIERGTLTADRADVIKGLLASNQG